MSSGNDGYTPNSQTSPARIRQVNTPHSSPGVIPSTPMDEFGSASQGASSGRRAQGMRSPLTPAASGDTATPHRSGGSLPRGDVGRNFSARKLPLPPHSQIPATPATPGASPMGGARAGQSLVIGSSMLDDYSQSQTQGISQTPGGYEASGDDNMEDPYGADQQIDMPVDTAATAGATIWGTDINIETCMNVFREFLNNFVLNSRHRGPAHYMRLLETMHATQRTVLNLDCAHLREHIPSRRLHSQLIAYPQELIPILDEVASQEYARAFGPEVPCRLQVRTYNLAGNTRPMRDLDPDNIDQLVSLKGLVIRCSPIIPDLKQAFFRCFSCADTVAVPIERGRIAEPTKCDSCKVDNCMELIHNRCLFSDKQLIRLQENINEIPEGETPQTVSLFVFDDLVDGVKPGDRVEVVGIYRAVARRVNPKMRSVRSIYKTYVDVVHFRQADHSSEGEATTVNDDSIVFPTTPHRLRTQRVLRHTTPGGTDVYDEEAIGEGDGSVMGSPLGQGQGGPAGTGAAADESEEIQFSPERVREFEEFAAYTGDSAYNRLTVAFAPSIWEMEDVKRGILCQLFGGTSAAVGRRLKRQARVEARRRRQQAIDAGLEEPMQVEEEEEDGSDEEDGDRRGVTGNVSSSRGNNIHKRQDLNVLLCGDPGTSKSQLLSYVHKITPRGIYTSGKGSSAVGLTASVVRDPETKDMVLESGALVLSDNGICCIDEFDKMSDSTRAILHEAMEQQTVSITKAGIIATLNARTSVLASANPVESRYNPRLSVVANLKLPPTLLSRFDLIYLILDNPNEESDRRLAKHLVSLYYPAASFGGGTQENTGSYTNTQAGGTRGGGAVSQEFLKDYIQYARHSCAPEITADSAEVLIGGYLAMRSIGSSKVGTKTISATPRQLESLIRLSQALAKMRLAKEVQTADVHEAIRLMRVATQAAATDPRTGTIDMDMLSTGRSSSDREAIGRLTEELLKLFDARRGERITLQAIRGMIEGEIKESVSLDDLEEALREVPESIAVKIDRTKTVAIK